MIRSGNAAAFNSLSGADAAGGAQPAQAALRRSSDAGVGVPGDEAPRTFPARRPAARGAADRGPSPRRARQAPARGTYGDKVGNLKALDRRSRCRSSAARGKQRRRTTSSSAATGARMSTSPAGLREIARYADGIGPSKDYIVPRDSAAARWRRRRWSATRTRQGLLRCSRCAFPSGERVCRATGCPPRSTAFPRSPRGYRGRYSVFTLGVRTASPSTTRRTGGRHHDDRWSAAAPGGRVTGQRYRPLLFVDQVGDRVDDAPSADRSRLASVVAR